MPWPDAHRASLDVIVWDDDGGAVATGIAQLLANEGVSVTIATQFGVIAPRLDASFEGWLARRHLHDAGVRMATGLTPSTYRDGAVTFSDEFGEEHVMAAESLVVVSQRISDDELFRTLAADAETARAAGVRHLLRIGDCVAPRPLGYAVADGHRLGREIDSERPAVPLTPRTERDADAAFASFDLAAPVATPVRRALSTN